MTTAARRLVSRLSGPKTLGLPYLVAVTAFLLVPVGILALYSFWEAGFLTVEQTFTLDTYAGILTSGSFWGLVFRSLLIGLVSAALITIAAFTLCHGIVFRYPRWKFILFGILIAASLASFMGRVLAARTLLGDGGVSNQILMALGITSGPVDFLSFGYPTVIMTLVYVWMPTAALILFGSLQDIDQTSLEASHDLGGGRWQTLWRVTVPQAATGLRSAFAMMFIVTTADYITPQMVGGTKGALVASGIQSTFIAEGDLPRGAAMAFVTVATLIAVIGLILGIVLMLSRLIGAVSRSTARRLTPRSTGRSPLAWVSLSAVATFPLLALQVIPIATIVIFSLNSAPIIGLPFTGFTTGWYSQIVAQSGFEAALTGSVTIMAMSVVGSLVLGVPLAFAMSRKASRRSVLTAILPLAVAAPIVIPPTVIGVAYYSSTLLFEIPLGILPTAVAHIMLSTPFVAIVLALRLTTADPYIGEAARDLGARSWYRNRTVTVPMMLPSIIGVAFLVAAYSMDEILVTTFTIGANSTLPIWMLSQARNGMNPSIGALAVILLLGTLSLFVLGAASMLALRLRVRRPAPAAVAVPQAATA